MIEPTEEIQVIYPKTISSLPDLATFQGACVLGQTGTLIQLGDGCD